MLFNHIDFFKPFEIKHYDECFVNHGMGGVDLSDVSKETFNIFCLRLYETFKAFKTDYKLNEITESNDDFQFLCAEFTATIKMLEKDKRYDSKWIKEYEMKTVMEENK